MILTKTLLSSLSIAITICFTSSIGEAQEKPSKVEVAAAEMIDSMDMEKVLNESIKTSLNVQMDQFKKMGLSDEGLVELEAAMLKFMLDAMSWKELRPEFVRIYSSNFTADELKQLTKFYKSPIGKKTFSLTPKLMAEGMLVGQKRVEERQPELQALIQPIFVKYMAQ